MCEYQRHSDKKLKGIPICIYTNKPCTLCVLGNADTYNKAKEAEKSSAYEKRRLNGNL